MDGVRRAVAEFGIITDNKHDLQRIKSTHIRMQIRKTSLPDVAARSPHLVALGDETDALENNRRRYVGRRLSRDPNDIGKQKRKFPKSKHVLESHFVCQEAIDEGRCHRRMIFRL